MSTNSTDPQAKDTFHIIVFSFNRAMQCESVLRSILERVKTPHLTVSVVWHATGRHLDGYRRLCHVYETKRVRFFERSGSIGLFRHVLPRLWMPRNLYHWLKHEYVRQADNFKPLLEQVIAETPADFVSFNTDDNIYYRDEMLPEAIFRRVREDPYGASYRVLQGINFTDCPSAVRRGSEFLQWDYYDPTLAPQSTWAYPFTVDGTFYAKSAVLEVIHRVLYHNPVTLESYLVGYVRQQRLFGSGFSPVYSSMVALPLNKVSFIVAHNARGNLSIADLNELFLVGYTLEYDLPAQITSNMLIPRQVTAVRGSERMVIPVLPDAERLQPQNS